MHFVFLFILMVFPISVHAQSDDALANLCAHINILKPLSADSSAYVPSVDVHGNSVVPADLDSGSGESIINNPIVLPFDINIAERYGLDLPAGIDLSPNISNMILSSEGHITYGNEDITASIKSLCENPNAQMIKNQSNQAEPHRHESANPVLSSDKIEGQYPED